MKIETPSANDATNNGSILEPMNLHNTIEFEELLRQRVLCGWDHLRSDIEAWRAAADAQVRSIFWVVPPSLSQFPSPQRFAGHVSMLSRTDPLDDEAARQDKSILYLTTLYILPEHRGGGLGRSVVQAVEAWAKVEPYGSPGCKAITLHAISKRYTDDDGDEWRGVYTSICARIGIPMPAKGSSNEDWYTRMGYVKQHEIPKYRSRMLDGTEVVLLATFLRKELA